MMAPSRSGPGRYEQDPTPFIAMAAIAAALFISAPGLLLGMAISQFLYRHRIQLFFAAVASAGWIFLMWDRMTERMLKAQHAAEKTGMLNDVNASITAAWPDIRAWWAMGIPLCFIVAFLFALLKPNRSRKSATTTNAAKSASATAPSDAHAAKPAHPRCPNHANR